MKINEGGLTGYRVVETSEAEAWLMSRAKGWAIITMYDPGKLFEARDDYLERAALAAAGRKSRNPRERTVVMLTATFEGGHEELLSRSDFFDPMELCLPGEVVDEALPWPAPKPKPIGFGLRDWKYFDRDDGVLAYVRAEPDPICLRAEPDPVDGRAAEAADDFAKAMSGACARRILRDWENACALRKPAEAKLVVLPEAVHANPGKGITVARFADGRTFRAKCSEGDGYDPEVGAALCLAYAAFGSKAAFREWARGATVDASGRGKRKEEGEKKDAKDGRRTDEE